MPESNLLSLVDQLDNLRDKLAIEQNPRQVLILRYWLNELENDLLCGYVALEQEFKRAWEKREKN